MAVQARWAGDMEEQQSNAPPYGALSPDRVRWYLRTAQFRSALPRPGAKMRPSTNKKRSGNPDELSWAIYGDLLACIQRLSARRRDIVIRCTVYGDPYADVAARWRCDPKTAWREERRAWEDIAAMTGWTEECEE